MLEFLQRILGKSFSSKKIAKERLRLVLLHDRTSLTPEILDSLKGDLIEVISRYMVIDQENLEVNLSTEEESVALVANIPILKVKQVS